MDLLTLASVLTYIGSNYIRQCPCLHWKLMDLLTLASILAYIGS